MERANRRKLEGTKFDFKLHFQASRVPASGWDKLVVSLLSIETGRITVRTSRGIVRDGACEWPDPVLESTILSQNPSTREYKDKLYKLFVQMGSLRAGILGEATINFAEYVAAESPEAVSLPLRNCNAGTILHLKIQRLAPKGMIRDIEGQRVSVLDHEYPFSVSEDNSSSSDISEYPAYGSLGSSANHNVASQLFMPASQHKNNNLYLSVRQKDELAIGAPSKPNSDIDDSSSHTNASSITSKGHVDAKMSSFGLQNHVLHPPAYIKDTDLYQGPERNTRIQPKSRRVDSNFSNIQFMQAELSNSTLSPQAKEHGVWITGSLPQKLEAAESTIKDLRDESSAWERQARKLGLEVDVLKQKLAYETRIGLELKIKVATFEAECNTLQSEVKQLKALKLKIHDSIDNVKRWEIEDSKRKIKVLQEEIQNGKEVNANLQMQLCMTQDSNVNLVTAMAELEVVLDSTSKAVEELEKANQNLEQELFDAHTELQRASVLTEDVEETSMVEWEQKHSSSMVEVTLFRTEGRIMSGFEELTSAQQQSVNKDENSAKFELASEVSGKQSLPRSKTDEFKFQKSAFQAKIVLMEEEVHAFQQEKGELLQNIEKETHVRTSLEAEVGNLGRETEKLNLDITARDNIIDELRAQLAEEKDERLTLHARIQSLVEERQIFSCDKDAEMACMLEKLQEVHADNNRKAQRLEGFVAEMEHLKDDLEAHVSKSEILESKRSELLHIKEELEAKTSDLEERNSSLLKRLSNVEMQLSVALQDEAHSLHIIENFKSEKLSFESQISRFQTHQTLLEQELRDSTRRSTEIQDELTDVEMKMRKHQQDSEDREHAFRLEITSILSCKRSLEQAAKSAEEALSLAEHHTSTSFNFLQSRLEFLCLIVGEKKNTISHIMAKIGNLQAEKLNLERSLRIMEERVHDLEQLSESLKGLDIKLKDVFIELDASRSLCSSLTEKLGEKESSLHELLLNQENHEMAFQQKVGVLEKELLEKATMLSVLESKLSIHESGNILKKTPEMVDIKVVLELEEKLRCLEAEFKGIDKGRMACKKDSLETETELMKKIECLEAANEQLAAGLMDSGADQLQQEIIRLQNQNFSLSRKEQELLSQMHTQEVLQKEVKRLEEANDLLELRLSKFVETAKNPFLIEKIDSLETELAEALEANHVYKLQLKSVLDKQQLGDPDQEANSLRQHKKKAAQLQAELSIMHERYSLVSLKLAEAEAERGELMITLKNLKGIHKK